MRLLRWYFVVFGLIQVANASSQAANLVVNGSFESPNIVISNTVVPAGDSALTGWQIAGTSGVDLVRSLWEPSAGFQSISLNWTSPSTISQSINTVSGQAYNLSFDLAAEVFGGSAVRTLDVMWNNVLVASPSFNYTGQSPNNMGWASLSYTVHGTGLDILKFVSTTLASSYGATLDNVSVIVPSVAHPGDFDSDGDVDGADFVAWQTNFPTSIGATLSQGDADTDGDVDGADFVVWQTNFPYTPGSAPVPEPSTIALALLSVPALFALRRRLR